VDKRRRRRMQEVANKTIISQTKQIIIIMDCIV